MISYRRVFVEFFCALVLFVFLIAETFASTIPLRMWGISYGGAYAWDNYAWEDYTTDERIARVVSDLKQLGINFWRPLFHWNMIEPIISNPNISVEQVTDKMVSEYAFNTLWSNWMNWKNWKDYDVLVEKSKRANIHLIPLISYGNDAEMPLVDKGNGKYERLNPDDVGKENYLGLVYLHTRGVVRRYKKIIHYWQIENELNITHISVPANLRKGKIWKDDKFLSQLLAVLYKAVKQECSDCFVTTHIKADTENYKQKIKEWSSFFDFIAIGFYPNYFSGFLVKGGSLGAVIKEIKNLNLQKEIVVIETGYPTKPENKGFSEKTQVQYLTESVQSAIVSGASGYFWINVVSPEKEDIFGMAGNLNVEPWWGLIRSNNTKKPAFSKFSHLIKSFSVK